MRRLSNRLLGIAGVGVLGALSITVACGGSGTGGSGFGSSSGSGSGGFASSGGSGGSGGSGSGGSGGSGSGGGSLGNSSSGGSSGSGGPASDGGLACPAGLQCNVSCSGGGTTSLKGKVYDPAKKNPLYNVAVYVPATPLVPLPKGVPTGKEACDCGALFQSGAITNTTTGTDGSFTLTNVPVGSNVPLVLQVGKWRRLVHVNVTACQDNAQPDQSLAFLGTVPAGDTDDNLPDIAVSTGSADTLECLMRRIGLPTTEYVAGAGSSGHIHVFAGGDSTGTGSNGTPESPGMTNAPPSSTDLWSTQAQLMPYDIVLLSCEGGETYNANPPALEAYLNVGGRAFASHYHYSWFSGPIDTTQTYTANTDWGTNLATWTGDNAAKGPSGPIGGDITQTLNTGGGSFAKGQALDKWLSAVGALGTGGGAGANQLSIYQPRYNASVSSTNAPSQPWITYNNTTTHNVSTMYFSFDAPVGAVAPPDGGSPPYCGRAVFSDLHVSGATTDSPSPPDGCNSGDLSPQEKALEFMIFDLSSCVLPDTIAPPQDAGLPPPPPK